MAVTRPPSADRGTYPLPCTPPTATNQSLRQAESSLASSHKKKTNYRAHSRPTLDADTRRQFDQVFEAIPGLMSSPLRKS
jgi:hypothetical protein